MLPPATDLHSAFVWLENVDTQTILWHASMVNTITPIVCGHQMWRWWTFLFVVDPWYGEVTSHSTAWWTACSGYQQRNIKAPHYWPFVMGTTDQRAPTIITDVYFRFNHWIPLLWHRSPVNSLIKGPSNRKKSPHAMTSPCLACISLLVQWYIWIIFTKFSQ